MTNRCYARCGRRRSLESNARRHISREKSWLRKRGAYSGENPQSRKGQYSGPEIISRWYSVVQQFTRFTAHVSNKLNFTTPLAAADSKSQTTKLWLLSPFRF
jgi:hypothetical protein